MGKTEKIGGLAEEAVEALTEAAGDRRHNKVARFLWTNAFPVICGLIVTGAAKWVVDVSESHAETKRDFVNFQLETDYKFRQTEDMLRSLGAENVALRKLLEYQQIELGVTVYKMDWMHPPRGSGPVGPVGPLAPATAEQPDWDKLIEAMEGRIAGRAKVDPHELERLLASKRPLYEQRQAPSMPPAGGR